MTQSLVQCIPRGRPALSPGLKVVSALWIMQRTEKYVHLYTVTWGGSAQAGAGLKRKIDSENATGIANEDEGADARFGVAVMGAQRTLGNWRMREDEGEDGHAFMGSKEPRLN